MKTLRIFLTLTVMFTGLSVFSQNIITENEVHVVITGETSREDLSQLRAQLHAVGVDFQYTPTFNSDRMLMGIEAKVILGESNGTGTNAMLSAPGEYISFKLSKQEGSPFVLDCIGKCEE
ncbi:MAG: hypothetical protein SH856_08710 [Flavobacteriales bacterium]|nr:hypothetical protein [Flavobacteriales bacterium]